MTKMENLLNDKNESEFKTSKTITVEKYLSNYQAGKKKRHYLRNKHIHFKLIMC